MGAITLWSALPVILKNKINEEEANSALAAGQWRRKHVSFRLPLTGVWSGNSVDLVTDCKQDRGNMSASALSSIAVPAASSSGFRLSKGILLRRAVVSLALNTCGSVLASKLALHKTSLRTGCAVTHYIIPASNLRAFKTISKSSWFFTTVSASCPRAKQR